MPRNDELDDRVETHFMTRIAVGGFLHETNTFAPTKATYADFVHGGGWPAMAHGAGVLKVMRNINVGLAGFVEAAQASGWELVPTISCGASPCAHVTKDAFERIAKVMVDGIANAGSLDAVYLDLHGAMVTEHLDDGEGEILARVRKVIGPDLPLVASLDLHANVTPLMVEHADALIAYRTYPHVDMAGTGRAAAKYLALLLDGQKFAKAFRQLPFLIPISWQCTNDQPTKGIYEKLATLESETVPTVSFCPGFPAADFPDCGPSVFAYGRTQADADEAADKVAALVIGHEHDFDGRIYTPDEGVLYAMELAKTASKPIVIADTQDNPGAGGDSDTTGMLRALVRNNAKNAAHGVIYDPQSAKAARAAGVGATLTLALGGKSGISGDAPYTETFLVEKLSDGKFVAPGPYYGGRAMDMGPSACLRIGDVRVVVSSHKAQLADQAMYRYVGIEPTQQSILVNKSSVHFRADFEPIAEKLLICAAPGAMPADSADLPWTRLRPGIRVKPNGKAFVPKVAAE
jgi:microcystin degradation protein MlrC